MNIYRYKAYDYKGKIYKGTMFGLSQEEVSNFLLKQNLIPIEIKLLPQSSFYRLLFRLFFRISSKQKLFLIRNLYLVLKSGLSLDKGLEILTRESKGSLRDFLYYLRYNLQRGVPLFKTLADFPQIFSPVEVETIKAGEVSGNLITNLEKLAENLERQRAIRGEVIANLIYPAIVLALSFGVIVLLITFVLPKINILISQLTENPPFFTRVLIVVSTFVNNNLSLVIASLVFFIFLFILVLALKRTRKILFSFFIKLPFISKIYLSLTLSQALFILRSLLGAGIHLTEAIRLTAETTSNQELKQAFLNVEKDLVKGEQLGEALKKQTAIPSFLSSVLGIASEAGALEETLEVMEKFYLDEFRNSVRNVLNLLQPALLVFVGGIVGFVAIAVLLPIYQQISQQLEIGGRGSAPGIPR